MVSTKRMDSSARTQPIASRRATATPRIFACRRPQAALGFFYSLSALALGPRRTQPSGSSTCSSRGREDDAYDAAVALVLPDLTKSQEPADPEPEEEPARSRPAHRRKSLSSRWRRRAHHRPGRHRPGLPLPRGRAGRAGSRSLLRGDDRAHPRQLPVNFHTEARASADHRLLRPRTLHSALMKLSTALPDGEGGRGHVPQRAASTCSEASKTRPAQWVSDPPADAAGADWCALNQDRRRHGPAVCLTWFEFEDAPAIGASDEFGAEERHAVQRGQEGGPVPTIGIPAPDRHHAQSSGDARPQRSCTTWPYPRSCTSATDRLDAGRTRHQGFAPGICMPSRPDLLAGRNVPLSRFYGSPPAGRATWQNQRHQGPPRAVAVMDKPAMPTAGGDRRTTSPPQGRAFGRRPRRGSTCCLPVTMPKVVSPHAEGTMSWDWTAAAYAWAAAAAGGRRTSDLHRRGTSGGRPTRPRRSGSPRCGSGGVHR